MAKQNKRKKKAAKCRTLAPVPDTQEKSKTKKKREYFTYPPEAMRKAVRDVLNGVRSIVDAAHFHKVPERTLRDQYKAALAKLKPKDGKYHEISTVKDNKGREPSLPRKLENKFKLFIEDCKRIGLPRCQRRCAEDIQAFLKQENIQNKLFVDDKPGSSYFKRFRFNDDGTELEFLTSFKVNDHMTRQVDVDQWIPDVKNYIMDVNDELISNKKLIFIMESQTFKTNTEPSKRISVLVIYDAMGTIIRWIIVSDGSLITDDFIMQQGNDVMFLKSDNGELNSICLKNAVIVIRRHIDSEQLEGNWIFFMDHFVASNFDLIVWNYCIEISCLAFAIPATICIAHRTLNMGAMARYTSLMLFFIHTRHVSLGFKMDEMDFLLLHKIVVHQLKAKGDMRMAICLMKFNKIVSKHVPEVQEEDEEDREGNEAVTNDVQPSTSKDKKTQQKKQSKRREKDASQSEGNTDGNKTLPSSGSVQRNKKKKKDATQDEENTDENQPGPSNDFLADVIYLRLDWQKGTQTGEDDFQKNNIDQMRMQFTVDEIKAEDFDSDYEKQVETNTKKDKRKSDDIDNEACTSSCQPVRHSKCLKQSEECETLTNKSEKDLTNKSEEHQTRKKKNSQEDQRGKKKSKKHKSKEEKQKTKEERSKAVTRMIHEIERELMEEGKEPYEVSEELFKSRLQVKIKEWKLKLKATEDREKSSETDESKLKGKSKESDQEEWSNKLTKADESESESRTRYQSRPNKCGPGGKGVKTSKPKNDKKEATPY